MVKARFTTFFYVKANIWVFYTFPVGVLDHLFPPVGTLFELLPDSIFSVLVVSVIVNTSVVVIASYLIEAILGHLRRKKS